MCVCAFKPANRARQRRLMLKNDLSRWWRERLVIHRCTGYISRDFLQHSILLMEFGSELQILSNNCQIETFEFATVQRCEPLLDLEQTPI